MISGQILRAYQKLRAKQSARSAASQATNFAIKVREASKHVQQTTWNEKLVMLAEDKSRFRYPQPKSKFPHSWQGFFNKSFPYSSGQPNPEYAIKIPGGTNSGNYYNVEAFGDPLQGHLSVGISGGVSRGSGFTGETLYTPLPDRWIGGDAISSSASLVQVVDLPPGLKAGAIINGGVQLSWVNTTLLGVYNTVQDLIYTVVYTEPGLPNSALNGFVGVTAMAELTVTLASDTAVLASNQVYNNILDWGIDAEFYGKVDDKVDAPFLFLDFAFRDDPWSPLAFTSSVPFEPGATRLFIEIGIRLFGARAGVNDPNAGNLAAGFLDLHHGASPVSFIPFGPDPFVINRVFAGLES